MKEKEKKEEENLAAPGIHMAKRKKKLKRIRGEGMSEGRLLGLEEYEKMDEREFIRRQEDDRRKQEEKKQVFFFFFYFS